jgi:hypothetical protein
MSRALHSVAWSVPFLLVLVTACGGGQEEDEESSSPWQCYENTDTGDCECHFVEPGAVLGIDGSSIVEVDECSGYPVCFSYYDEFFEEERCDCGEEGFVPLEVEGDLSALTMVESCPAE